MEIEHLVLIAVDRCAAGTILGVSIQTLSYFIVSKGFSWLTDNLLSL